MAYDPRGLGFGIANLRLVAVRGSRRDAMDLLKDAEKEKEITEDERKNGEKRVQDLTDKYVALVDELAVAKEKEIMEI